MKLSHCRSCDAPVIWTVTTNGKKMPVDADPLVLGWGFRLDEETDPPVAAFAPAQIQERLYQSHFVTCPNAATHRSIR